MFNIFSPLTIQWRTSGSGDYLKNIAEILDYQYKESFPETSKELIKFETQYKKFKIAIVLTKPFKLLNDEEDHIFLTKRNLHFYINKKPCDIPLEMKNLFYELYGTFGCKAGATPYVAVHFETEDLNSYQIVLNLDMRSVCFHT